MRPVFSLSPSSWTEEASAAGKGCSSSTWRTRSISPGFFLTRRHGMLPMSSGPYIPLAVAGSFPPSVLSHLSSTPCALTFGSLHAVIAKSVGLEPRPAVYFDARWKFGRSESRGPEAHAVRVGAVADRVCPRRAYAGNVRVEILSLCFQRLTSKHQLRHQLVCLVSRLGHLLSSHSADAEHQQPRRARNLRDGQLYHGLGPSVSRRSSVADLLRLGLCASSFALSMHAKADRYS